ncbi:MAG: endonuclease/exonuclease/phosphatase family protein [Prevotella sp.]|nr:endonuclease/exonuclease/phosphatase family protein [Prevotella sp.]
MKVVKNILLNVFTGASATTALLLVLVAYSDRFHPQEHPYLACAGLTFPFFLLVNTLIFIAWLVVSWRRAWIPLAAFLLTLPVIRVYLPLHFHHDPPPGCLKIVSYNVANYVIAKEQPEKEKTIYNYLHRQNADIVCLQEDVTHGGDPAGDFTNLYAYNDTVWLGLHRKKVYNAVGIHSRYPIVGKEIIEYESSSNGSVAFFVKVGTDTVLIINNHLETTHLTKVDRQRYTDMISGEMDRDAAEAETRKIIDKLSVAMVKRASQARAVHDYIERHRRYPMVVCGDFNDTPVSYARRIIAQGLTDCFVETGCGLGFTFFGKGFYFRIDHILCSDHFEPYNCYVDNQINASDHYPIICWLKRKQ